MVAYKEWGYQLYPSLAFEDLASRTEKLGGKARVRDIMQEFRDKERERYVESKYGHCAVADMRAQEALKDAEKEAAVAEEQKESQPTNSRYMDTDVGKSRSPKKNGEGAENTPAAAAASVVSAQVRERMEANRRLALERLRLRKEEAAAKAKAAATPNNMPADDEVANLMDVDAEEAGSGHNFEDDEAALDEMETGATTRNTQQGVLVDAAADNAVASAVFNSSGLDAAQDPASVPPSTAATYCVEDSTLKESVEALPEEIRGNGTPVAPRQPEVDDEAVPDASAAISKVASTGADVTSINMEDVHEAAICNAVATGIFHSGSRKPSIDLGSTQSAVSIRQEQGETAKDSGIVTGVQAPAAALGAKSATGTVGRVVDAEASGVRVADGADNAEPPSFGSPQKIMSNAGGVPLSPLGSMFVGTDVPAEGGSMAVKAPVGALFADQSL